jgi:hypothetical protein
MTKISTAINTCVNNLGGCFQDYTKKILDVCGSTFDLSTGGGHSSASPQSLTAAQLTQVCSDDCGKLLADDSVLQQFCPGSMFIPDVAAQISEATKSVSKIRSNILCPKSKGKASQQRRK